MSSIKCSAPGKIYLFGEHAVVYGKNAICCAVDLRTTVTATVNDGIIINSLQGETALDHTLYPYVSTVIETIEKFISFPGVKLDIISDIPVGSGIGSSAAVTIATLQAMNLLFKCKMDLETIAHLGHTIETKIQGAASPTDTYVSTMGGIIMIPAKRKLPTLDCKVIIGNTGKFASTKELVSHVSMLRNNHTDILDSILSTIGELSIDGEQFVSKKAYKTIGTLMDINQGLLDAIGVNNQELNSLIYAARNNNAIGSKLTGAGGGGCMFALAESKHVHKIADGITKAGGESIITNFTNEGVRIED